MNPSQNPSALHSKKIITDTLLMLMKKYSYNKITIKLLLIESKISRKTFYRNFLSKDDVSSSYIDAVLAKYLVKIHTLGSYSLLPILDIIFPFCVNNKDMLFILRDNGLLHILLIKLNQTIQQEHEKIARTALDSNTQYIISFNIGAMWNIIATWIENDMQDDAMDIKETLYHYLSNIKDVDLRDI